MKKFKYILLLLLFLVVAASIYIATLENTYDVKRSIKIKAPVSVVYKQVNDFKNWPSWSPWLQQDPDTQLSYGDRTSGDGATYSWKSGIIGEGKMETITAIPDDSISQKMELMRPWDSKSDVYWVFRPVNDSTEVTWGMKGSMGFLDRAFIALRGGMDKMVGPDYEKGLVKLDSVVQADMARYSIRVDGITRHGGGYYLYNTASCKIDELSEKMQEMMPVVTDYVQKNNIPMAGAPYALYLKYDTENNAAIFSCAVPVTDRVITAPDSGVQTGYLNPFSALKVTLKGNYTNLEQAWNTAMKYIADNNLKEAVNDPHLEVYPNGPENTPNPADWVTEIYIPVEENN